MVSAYNYDGSDSMFDHFDVNFYAHVDFGWEWERDARVRELAAMAPVSQVSDTIPAPAPSFDEDDAMDVLWAAQ